MLRQAGAVLNQAVAGTWSVARTGGDEFAILMPGANEADSLELMAAVTRAIGALGDEGVCGRPSLSMGAATRRPGELLDATIARADAEMYRDKQVHYNRAGRPRYEVGFPLFGQAPNS